MMMVVLLKKQRPGRALLSTTSPLLLLWTATSAAAALLPANITVSPTAAGINYEPLNAWSISSDSQATTGRFSHASSENASVTFNFSTPSTAVYWHGFLPKTAARYSICIDCASIDELGEVVTLDAPANGRPSTAPVILFASQDLLNTTHSVTLRNLRNSIAGVVGEISLDTFSFSTVVEIANQDPSPAQTSAPSTAQIAGIVIGAILLAGLLLVAARYIAIQHRRGAGLCDLCGPDNITPNSAIPVAPSNNRKRKIWRKSLFASPGHFWRGHNRTGTSESAPIIEAVWKSKPLVADSTLENLPIHNLPPQLDRHSVASQLFRSSVAASGKAVLINGMPAILITSPTTVPTTASTYSSSPSSQERLPPPSPFKLSLYDTRGSVRQSDPYVAYAAAYASFIGMADERDNDSRYSRSTSQEAQMEKGDNGMARQEQQIYSRIALHESLLLPLSQPQERNLTMNTPRGTFPSSSEKTANSTSTAPPSSFKGAGIVTSGNREGQKGTRTLSDKIKRGTLPPAPSALRQEGAEDEGGEEEAELSSRDVEPRVVEGGDHTQVESQVTVPQPRNSDENHGHHHHHPSMLPTYSSSDGSSPTRSRKESAPTIPEGRVSLSSIGNDVAYQINPPVPASEEAAIPESTFWSSHPNFLDEVVPELPTDEPNVVQRPTSLQSPTSPGATSSAHRATRSDGGIISNKSQPGIRVMGSSVSIMTLDTTRTTRSSISMTPSISEFPTPPFKRASALAPDSRSSSGAFTDLLAPTPTSSSGSQRLPPSAFGSSSRPKRARPPSSRLLAAAAALRNAQSALEVPLSSQTRSPVRRRSSKLSTSSRTSTSLAKSSSRQSSGSRSAALPIRGDARVPLPSSVKGSQSGDQSFDMAEAGDSKSTKLRGSTFSEATGESVGSEIQFFLHQFRSQTPVEDVAAFENQQPSQPESRNPSRMTMASTLTTTDEEYASDVKLLVATRQVPSDVPRAVSLAPSAEGKAASASLSAASSDGRWDMVTLQQPSKVSLAAKSKTGLSITTERSPYRTANVPVSARTDLSEGDVLTVAYATESNSLMNQVNTLGLGSGMGMPWSPSFDWPATPPLDLFNPPPAPTSTRRRDLPTSISASPVEAWSDDGQLANVISPKASLRRFSDMTVASGETPPWNEIVGKRPSINRRRPSSRATRDSTFSTASSFFHGTGPDIPPVPPIPGPTPAALSPPLAGSISAANNRQEWKMRSVIASQSPTDKSFAARRRTGGVAVGGVNSVFATSGSVVTRPKLSLQRVEGTADGFGVQSRPTSRFNSPYAANQPTPSSATPLTHRW